MPPEALPPEVWHLRCPSRKNLSWPKEPISQMFPSHCTMPMPAYLPTVLMVRVKPSAQRVNQASGYKSKTMLTRMGEVTFEVPNVRAAGFYPSDLEPGSRAEQSVPPALAEMNFPEGFTVFGLPPEHRVRMRMTNGLERLNKGIKRRTRVATLFPNSASCLRLVTAILAEQDEE